jgi:multicomponent Na+:H+ antiporter subunit E
MKVAQKIIAILKLYVRYTIDFWSANITIAKQVLSPDLKINPGIIVLDTKVEKPLEILTLANLITFTPGTLVLGIDPGKTLVVHVLDGAEEAKVSIPRDLEQPILSITRNS